MNYPSSPLRRSDVELPHKGGSRERGGFAGLKMPRGGDGGIGWLRRIGADLIRPVCATFHLTHRGEGVEVGFGLVSLQ